MQRETDREQERGGTVDRHTKIATKHTHMPVFRRHIKQKPKQATPSDRLDE